MPILDKGWLRGQRVVGGQGASPRDNLLEKIAAVSGCRLWSYLGPASLRNARGGPRRTMPDQEIAQLFQRTR